MSNAIPIGAVTETNKALQHYLDVVIILAEKDFKIRYRNSVLGFLWSLLNPLAYMVLLWIVFSFLLRVSIPNFAAWLLIGLLIWRFFAVGTMQGLTSIVGNPSLINRIYVSRYIVVLSNNVANLLGSSLEFMALLPMLVFFGVTPNTMALLLPLLLLLEFLLIFALSLSLAALNLKYRDFGQLWDIALQLGFFLSPIVYDASLIPPRYQLLYFLNPVTRIIDSTRDIFLRSRSPSGTDFLVIVTCISVLLCIGTLIFRSLEPKFAEEI